MLPLMETVYVERCMCFGWKKPDFPFYCVDFENYIKWDAYNNTKLHMF